MDRINIGYNDRMEKQLQFIVEIDGIKNILRKSKLFDGNRFENDAEHSWTICIMALLLKEYADFPINTERVMTMLLIHDIVELDAGDTFLYAAERGEAHNKELIAADRIFGLLEEDQKNYFLDAWNEFEERKTNEAKFAAIFDRLEPLVQNYINEGFTWKKHNITYDMIIEKNKHIKEASEEIWKFVLEILNRAIEKGYLTR
ncbi:hydrolase [Spirochaetia bacterium]|nr:hydrolase [Spirochaetia bacterium]